MKIGKGPSAPTHQQLGTASSSIPGITGFGILHPKQKNRFLAIYSFDTTDFVLSRQTVAVKPNFTDDCIDVIFEDDLLGNTATELYTQMGRDCEFEVRMLDGTHNVIMTWKYKATLQVFHYEEMSYSTGDVVNLRARFVVSDWEIVR